MKRRVLTFTVLAASVLGLVAPGAQAKPYRPSGDCGVGDGTELAVMVWTQGLRDGSGMSKIRRVRISDECTSYGLLWLQPDASSVGTSLLVAPGAGATLTSDELALLEWDVPSAAVLASDVDPGRPDARSFCDVWWNQTENPAWVLNVDGVMESFSC
jgi:hypothetical protein